MMVRLHILLPLLTVLASAQGINWNGNRASHCDFRGNDLTKVNLTTAEQCGGRCENTPGCTHFTWTDLKGGTCWMKTGSVSKTDAFPTCPRLSHVCGIVGHGGANAQGIVWRGNWAMHCDFRGNDLSNARTMRRQCGLKCKSTSGCTHYNWTNVRGGTCWMKTGRVSKKDALFSKGDQGIANACGIVFSKFEI